MTLAKNFLEVFKKAIKQNSAQCLESLQKIEGNTKHLCQVNLKKLFGGLHLLFPSILDGYFLF